MTFELTIKRQNPVKDVPIAVLLSNKTKKDSLPKANKYFVKVVSVFDFEGTLEIVVVLLKSDTQLRYTRRLKQSINKDVFTTVSISKQ